MPQTDPPDAPAPRRRDIREVRIRRKVAMRSLTSANDLLRRKRSRSQRQASAPKGSFGREAPALRPIQRTIYPEGSKPGGPPGDGYAIARVAFVRRFQEMYPAAVEDLRSGMPLRQWARKWHIPSGGLEGEEEPCDAWLWRSLVDAEWASMLPREALWLCLDWDGQSGTVPSVVGRLSTSIRHWVKARARAVARLREPDFAMAIDWCLQYVVEHRSCSALAAAAGCDGKKVWRAIDEVRKATGLTIVPLAPGRRRRRRTL